MALIQMEFKSETLKRTVPVNVILPIEKFKGPYPTLYLLHGLTDNCNGWHSYSRIRLWAEDSGLAVVMPSGENSFYIQNAMKGRDAEVHIGRPENGHAGTAGRGRIMQRTPVHLSSEFF